MVNGEIRLCGCDDSPIIGNIWDGIDSEWEELDCIKEKEQLEEQMLDMVS